MRDSSTKGHFEHFSSIRSELRPLLDIRMDVANQVRLAQEKIDQINIYRLFSTPLPEGQVDTRIWYESRLREMLSDKRALVTMTDIAMRFGIVFERNDITGYVMRYKADSSELEFADKVKILPANHVLNIDVIAAAVKQYRINAIMMSSSELSLRLAAKLVTEGYTTPITFIIGRYAYNYFYDNRMKKLVPKFNEEMAQFETVYKYEYGFFEPFTGLAYQNYLVEREKHHSTEEEET